MNRRTFLSTMVIAPIMALVYKALPFGSAIDAPSGGGTSYAKAFQFHSHDHVREILEDWGHNYSLNIWDGMPDYQVSHWRYLETTDGAQFAAFKFDKNNVEYLEALFNLKPGGKPVCKLLPSGNLSVITVIHHMPTNETRSVRKEIPPTDPEYASYITLLSSEIEARVAASILSAHGRV